MTCEICSQVLAAKYAAKDLSGRLHARALRGAEVLKTAAATTDLVRFHRISLTLQVMSVLKIGRLWSLTSGNKRERLLALAAVGIGTTRPLLGAAIILRGNDLAARELSRVFPEHRQTIERIRGLSQDLGRPFPELGETGHPTGHETHGLCRPRVSESALQAACQAISELGADANRQALLTRADAIWKHSSGVKS